MKTVERQPGAVVEKELPQNHSEANGQELLTRTMVFALIRLKPEDQNHLEEQVGSSAITAEQLDAILSAIVRQVQKGVLGVELASAVIRQMVQEARTENIRTKVGILPSGTQASNASKSAL